MSEHEPTQVTGIGLTIPPGTRLNGIFEIERQIGAGGMGMVYRAHNIETGDKVAIKIVRAEMADNQQVIALFRKEAAVLNRLLHGGIVRYYLFTSDPKIGRPYLATEFVEGTSLADMGTVPRNDVLALAQRLAEGLAAAHAVSIVHRDISPDNVILPERDVRQAKIIDFGIAKAATVGGGTVIGDSIAGKFDYMSPEQLGLYGAAVDGRSDIYSLGIVLAEATIGRSLKMGGTQLEVVEKRRKVPDLSTIEPGLRGLLTAMLQPKPADRIQTMAEVARQAEALRVGKVGGRKKALAPIAAGIVVLCAVGVGGYFALGALKSPLPVAEKTPPVLVRQDNPPTTPPGLGRTEVAAGRPADQAPASSDLAATLPPTTEQPAATVAPPQTAPAEPKDAGVATASVAAEGGEAGVSNEDPIDEPAQLSQTVEAGAPAVAGPSGGTDASGIASAGGEAGTPALAAPAEFAQSTDVDDPLGGGEGGVVANASGGEAGAPSAQGAESSLNYAAAVGGEAGAPASPEQALGDDNTAAGGNSRPEATDQQQLALLEDDSTAAPPPSVLVPTPDEDATSDTPPAATGSADASTTDAPDPLSSQSAADESQPAVAVAEETNTIAVPVSETDDAAEPAPSEPTLPLVAETSEPAQEPSQSDASVTTASVEEPSVAEPSVVTAGAAPAIERTRERLGMADNGGTGLPAAPATPEQPQPLAVADSAASTADRDLAASPPDSAPPSEPTDAEEPEAGTAVASADAAPVEVAALTAGEAGEKGPGETASADAGTLPPAVDTASIESEEAAEAAASPETEVAALGPNVTAALPEDPVARFVARADVGPCTHLRLVSSGENSAEVEAFGSDIPALARFDTAFTDTLGFEANIAVRLLTAAQCPAVELVEALDKTEEGPLTLQVQNDVLDSGDVLSGSIAGLDGRDLHLYLVTSDGQLYGLADLVTRGKDNAVFHTMMSGTPGPAPGQLLIVIAGNDLPLIAGSSGGNKATDLDTLRQMLEGRPDIEATLGYFKFNG